MSGKQHLTVVGSAALDTIETPHGRVERTVGGSAFFIAAAGSLYAPLHLIAVVGEDFPMAELDFLRDRGVDLDGLQVAPGQTFHWEGRYHNDMNRRDTICTELGVFEDYSPVVPEAAGESKYLLLANIDPALQLQVLDAVREPRLTAMDTMNLWINTQPELVMELVRRVNLIVLNDEELAALTGVGNLFEGADRLLSEGPDYIIVKKGEHGAVLAGREREPFLCPAFPLRRPVDPTGAGDTFAGALMGYLAASDELSDFNMRRAVVHGTVAASFAVEDFGLGRLKSIGSDEIEKRYRAFQEMLEV